jgi:hypothetical protein
MKREESRIMAIIILTLTAQAAFAQGPDLEKHPFEVGGQVGLIKVNSLPSIVTIDDGRVLRSSQFDQTFASIGGRIGYNLNRHIGLEAEGNFIPKRNFSEVEQSRKAQFLAGVKAGIRKETFGIFAKVRPGVMYFSRLPSHTSCTIITPRDISCAEENQTNFALDVGGVLEFYPSPRTVIRFDAGNTMVRFKDAGPTRLINASTFTPAATVHNFQVSVGVSFRW